MIKKDFDGWIEFVEKIVKADKEETARLYGRDCKTLLRTYTVMGR